MYLGFTRMPGESYRRPLRSVLLYLCYVFRALINSLVCWLWHGRNTDIKIPPPSFLCLHFFFFWGEGTVKSKAKFHKNEIHIHTALRTRKYLRGIELYKILIYIICWGPHLQMSPKRFTMGPVALPFLHLYSSRMRLWMGDCNSFFIYCCFSYSAYTCILYIVSCHNYMHYVC